MGAFIDLTNKVFGRLIVTERVTTNEKSGHVKWLCECLCGNTKIINGKSLRNGDTKSCGCIRKETCSDLGKLSKGSTPHNKYIDSKYKKLHWVWAAMLQRCNNENNKSYKNYGGRGITVCKEWYDFKNFWDWSLRNNYTQGLTIERIDVDGNYEPLNCTWIVKSEQSKNRRPYEEWDIEK